MNRLCLFLLLTLITTAARAQTTATAPADPGAILQQANLLIRQRIERDVNVLEYWGENPAVQQSLRPVARDVIDRLTRAEELARRQAEELGNQLRGPDDPRARHWEELTATASSAAYTRRMAMYALALSLPPNSDERVEIATDAIDYLKAFDNPASGVQPTIRGRIAKLQMMRGALSDAQDVFATLIAPSNQMQPAPDWNQQFEARYFSALCDLYLGKFSDARQKLAAMQTWQQSTVPADAKARDGADAAIAMLDYRLVLAEAHASRDPAARQAAASRAREILLALLKRRSDLRPLIFDQLASLLPADLDIKTLDPLLLEAIMQRADAERLKTAPDKPEPATLERGIAAARQLLGFRGRADIDVETTSAAALLIPLLEERLGRDAEAATGLLDYLRDFGVARKNSVVALDAAQSIIGRLRADPKRADDPKVIDLYQRFLPIALADPFNRRELAFEYARLLQSQNKLAQAADLFGQVPRSDPRIASARFYQLVCTRQRLEDPKLDRAERERILQTFQNLSDQVATLAGDSLKRASSDAERSRWRSIIVRTMLLSADVARREQNNPQRTLTLLENIERAAAGLEGEQELLASALYTRVQAYMALGQNDQATASLVKLLQSRSGNEGASIVHDLMQRLNQELDQAHAAGDRPRMAAIARDRATLSGFLVQWARENSDPNIRRYSYRYSVFDAAAKRTAADLIPQPDERIKALLEALKLYRNLEAPEQAALYRQTIDPTSGIDPTRPDPQVSLGIGLICYDVGDYAEAQKRLGQLLLDRKLGSPTTTIQENGVERTIDNDAWWEATLKLLRSNFELAKTPNADAAAMEARKQSEIYLKQLYVQWGAKTGGKKWRTDFEKLRAEVIPDFKVSGE